MMRNGFTRGLLIGGVLGAAVSMMMEPGMMKGRNKRKLMRNGRNVIRRSGEILGDVVDMFR